MIGIAFQGSACRAAFHAGVATALVEGGLDVRLTAGASSGSLCAAAWAAGKGTALPDIFRSLSGRSVLSLRRALWNRSLFDMSHLLRTTLTHHLGGLDVREHPTEALIVATRLRSFERVVYSSRGEADLVEPLLGSCFLPVLYGRPVRVRGELLVDGGITDNLPIEELAARGATEIIAVLTRADGTVRKDLRRARWRPNLAGRTGAKLHVIKPKQPLAIRSWDFDRDRLERAIDEGYARGRELLGS